MTGSSLPTTLEQALQPSHEARTICEPNEPFRIVHVNDMWCQTCGYDAEEVLGLTCKMLQGVGTCRATLSMLRQALLLKRNFAVQLLNYTKRGRPFMNTLQVTPLVNAEGHVTHYLGVIIARFLDGTVSVPAAVQQSSKSGPGSLGMHGWSDHGSSSANDDVVMELAPGDSSTSSEEGSSSSGWAPCNGRVPPFLTKLSEILSKEPSDVITSTPETSSFRIWDAAKFAKEVLPQYFKHNKLGSFSQQLHTYGFRRKPNSSSTDLSVEFYHDQYTGPSEKFLDWIRAGGAQSKRSNPAPAKEAPPPSCVDSPPPPQLLEDLVVVAEGTRQLAQVFNQAKAAHAIQLKSILMKLMLRGMLAPESATYISIMPPATPAMAPHGGAGGPPRHGSYNGMPDLPALRWNSSDGLQAQLDALDAGLVPLSSANPRLKPYESSDLQGDEALQLFAESSMPMHGRPMMPDMRQQSYSMGPHHGL